MMLKQGLQEVLLREAPTNSGVTIKDFSVQSDAVLVLLWVDAVVGTLDVKVYGILDDGSKEVLLFDFPDITTPTTSILQKRSGIVPTRLRVKVSYTGSCSYELSARAVSTGTGDTRIVSSNALRMSQQAVGPAITLLVPASLTDRNALVIKNNSTSGTIYLAETEAKTNSSVGWPLGPKDALGVEIQAGVALYAVSDGPTCDIRLVESGA